MSKVYQIVQEKIIEKIEEAIENGGTAPWRKPWKGGIPKNYVSRKPYRGINLMMLESGSYLTFKQIKDISKKNPKVKLKKGSKSHIVVFWNFVDKKDSENEDDKYPLLRYYRVFSVKDVEGIHEEVINFETDPIDEAEKLIEEYGKECKIRILDGSGSAYYTPLIDSITMPSRRQFPKVEEYYSTFFHEMVHSTGHKSRLNRFQNIEETMFGSESYSKEELVAEIGSNMILSMLGIENEDQQENSISYLYGWLSRIKEDPKLITHAAQQAQKSSDYLLDFVSDATEGLVEPLKA